MSKSRSSSFSSASDDQSLSSRSESSDSRSESPSDEETKSDESSEMSDQGRGRRYRNSSEVGNSLRNTSPTGRVFAVDQPGTSCQKHQRLCECCGMGCTKEEMKNDDKKCNPYNIQGCSYYGTEERTERKEKK